MIYIVSGHSSVVRLDPATGATKTIVTGLTNANGIALDSAGQIYVDVGEPNNQVTVYDTTGKPVRTIGQQGGRAIGAAWNPNGMRYADGMTVDSEGKLWVTENDDHPKRVSVWDTGTGAFVKEFFGSTHYGAMGGVIDPRDPDVMVGSGANGDSTEDGIAKVTYVFPQPPSTPIAPKSMQASGFGIGSNGRLYLATSGQGTMTGIQSSTSTNGLEMQTTNFAQQSPSAEVAQPSGRTKMATEFNSQMRSQRWPKDCDLLAGSFICPGVDILWQRLCRTGSWLYACGAPKYDLANAMRIQGVIPTEQALWRPMASVCS